MIVARAPGRLDVMGGIADYSGSLVLQLPLSEACHVALQTHPPDQQKVCLATTSDMVLAALLDVCHTTPAA